MVDRKYLYTEKEVQEMFKISRVTLWRRIREGQFPKPVKGLSKKLVFCAAEVEEFWMDLLQFNGKGQYIKKEDEK